MNSKGLTMNIDRAVLVFASLVILASVALTYLVSPWWLLLTAFVGFNMMQAAFTGFCPAAKVFKVVGCPKGEAFR
jgi:hypothetical protein